MVDVVRLLAGGVVRSVRAQTGVWDAARRTEGAFQAFLSFENGVGASLTYSGYAHFDSDELTGWVGELGQPKDETRYGDARRALLGSARDEAGFKNARNYGGAAHAPQGRATAHQHFGFLLASCERADLRPLPGGVMIYGDAERRLDEIAPPAIPRREVFDELHAAVVEGVPPLHDGAWSLATMEVCLAMLQSSREGREVPLLHQIAAGN
jgi:phthalate 4,5-cis-dihydrodiol dehydrogenase